MITVEKLSAQSLILEMRFKEQALSTGTGFVVTSEKGPLLITNRHNVTGRHQDNDKPLSSRGAIPDNLIIFHNVKGQLGTWKSVVEPLYYDIESEQKRWIEHPVLGAKADLVALPLTQLDDVEIIPHDLESIDNDIFIAPAETVSVIGFPFGITVGGCFAVWATGFIASEPGIDYNDLPIQLIDCRSRPGQSGSPVVAHRSGGMIRMTDGSSGVFNGSVSKLIGIYSGRVNAESDIGIVWKTKAILDLVNSF